MHIAQAAIRNIAFTIAEAQSTTCTAPNPNSPRPEPAHLQHWNGRQIASAICADTNHPSHAAQDAHAGARIYVAAILTSAHGYDAEAPLWGGYLSAGRSGIWRSDGALLLQAEGTGDWLVVACAA